MNEKQLRQVGLCGVVIVTVLIVLFSLERSGHVPTIGESNVVGHMLAYAAWAFSFGLWRFKRGRWVFQALVLAFLLGGLLELLQPYFGRYRSGFDLLGDVAGSALGLIGLWLCARLYRVLKQ